MSTWIEKQCEFIQYCTEKQVGGWDSEAAYICMYPTLYKGGQMSIVKRKRGRPKKGELGLPAKKGDAAIINEYRHRMLASPKSRLVLEKIYDAALDDDHAHQAQAWRILTDRILHSSYFEKDKLAGSTASININITGIKDEKVVSG